MPDFHGGLLSDGRARRVVAAELRGESPTGSDGWTLGARVLRGLGAGWHVPELDASLIPAWDEQGANCDAIRAHLSAWVRQAA